MLAVFMLFQSFWSAITYTYQWLKQLTFISRLPGGWESQIKVLVRLESSEGSLTGLHVAGRELPSSLASSYKGTDSIPEGSTFMA